MIDPFLEDTHCQLMQSFAKLGNRAATARQYLHIEELLRDGLGVEPLPSTQELYQRLVQ